MDLVLASSSRYRARVLQGAGYRVTPVSPEVDERSLDHWLIEQGPEALAVELARRKLDSVLLQLHRDPPMGLGPTSNVPVVAGDQVGVLDTPDGPALLAKTPDPESAVRQLRRLSGTTHRLVNGLAVGSFGRSGDAADRRVLTGVDVQEVTFRGLTDGEIADYVARFEPFDTAGSYRLEDDERAGRPPFVTSVRGEDPSGVLGLPLPLLRRLLEQLTVA